MKEEKPREQPHKNRHSYRVVDRRCAFGHLLYTYYSALIVGGMKLNLLF